MFLCRPTHGKVLAGSTSFASQTTTAAGRHIMSNPVRPSERYESAAVSANRLNQARTRALAIRKQPRRRAVRGTQQTGDRGWPCSVGLQSDTPPVLAPRCEELECDVVGVSK